jgi:site-specific DNA-methyltransferase (adenine-specific)
MTTPYYVDDLVTLYHGKFEEIVPQLDIQPDLVVADPPYGETTLEWDTWPDGWPALVAAWGFRSMWVFGSMRMLLDRRDEFADWRFSQDVVWEKHNGSGLNADRFKRVHEHATHWYRGPWSAVHHETPTTNDARARTIRRKQKPTHQNWVDVSHYSSEDGGPRLMRSVMFHRSMHGSAINETEKPAPLVSDLIQYACPPGGLVLDIFGGSCSSLVAVRNLGGGRRGIAIEERESQCEKAVSDRLSQQALDLGGVS